MPTPAEFQGSDLQRRIMQRADDQWQHELVREYGAAAGDARYDARGYATDELKALKATRDEAVRYWHQQGDSRRAMLQGSR